MTELATGLATSAAFYSYVAPNLGAIIAVFWIGIAGLAYVAARCLGKAFMKGEQK